MAIYAMSDIHGMYGSLMRRIMQLDMDSIKSGENMLIMLGDYIDVGNHSFKVLKTLFDMQKEVGNKNMIVLLGNHDKWFVDFLEGYNNEWISDVRSFKVLEDFLTEEENVQLNNLMNHMEPGREKTKQIVKYVNRCLMNSHGDMINWLKKLPLYYKTDKQIFVHAGIDEDADDWWETGTSDEMFIEKYPPTMGKFYMDIIAGHVSTSAASGDRDMHDIFFDGDNHFFIDGVDSYPYSTKDDDRVIPLLVYEECDGYGMYYSLLENGERKILKQNTPKGDGTI
ncbi:MAG: metallophosphoesterase [Lachnospiraceae bacterium]